MKYILPAAAIFFLLLSCERETRITIPPQIPRMVAEGRQAQNVFPQVRISRTRGVTESLPPGGQADPYVIKNAVALLYENDILKDTLKYDTTTERYKASIARIQAGKTYKLVLDAPGFPAAEAISITPVLLPLNNLSFARNVRVDKDGNQQDEVKVSFTDNAATEDYYLVRIRNADGEFLYCVNTNDKDVEKLVYEDPLYPEDCLQSNRLLLSDINFNGTGKTIIFYVPAGSLDLHNSAGGIKRSTVELLHINRDFYKYVKSLNSFENAEDNPFAEPVNLYSNVKNGYGLFTTYAMAIDSIR